ncbi:MAG: hypothetical protein H6Q09_1766, partial [Acidobacteria bacterium]|nr:hypothetical protein [Acidobacteriota bacterium]
MRHHPLRLRAARLALAPLLLAAVACSGKRSNPAAPSTPSGSGAAIAYTAIGASDAAGVGASAVCVPFTACPEGTGYVPVIARDLRTGGATV